MPSWERFDKRCAQHLLQEPCPACESKDTHLTIALIFFADIVALALILGSYKLISLLFH
jgi:hypothetical protein